MCRTNQTIYCCPFDPLEVDQRCSRRFPFDTNRMCIISVGRPICFALCSNPSVSEIRFRIDLVKFQSCLDQFTLPRSLASTHTHKHKHISTHTHKHTHISTHTQQVLRSNLYGPLSSTTGNMQSESRPAVSCAFGLSRPPSLGLMTGTTGSSKRSVG